MSDQSGRGSETVLVVEDDEALRRVAERILSKHGYTVLLAADGEEALRVAEAHAGPIDMVLTDVVMPGMSGRDVVRQLRTTRPSTRALYTSGYADITIASDGVLDEGVHFIAKPYSVQDLARKVRAVLDD